MNLIKRYNQIMGPKDERLEAEENKSMKVGGTIFFIMGFLVGFAAITLTIHDAIKRRRALESELED